MWYGLNIEYSLQENTSVIMILPCSSCDGLSSKVKENPKLSSLPTKCYLGLGYLSDLTLTPCAHCLPVVLPSLNFSSTPSTCFRPSFLTSCPCRLFCLAPSSYLGLCFNPHQSLSSCHASYFFRALLHLLVNLNLFIVCFPKQNLFLWERDMWILLTATPSMENSGINSVTGWYHSPNMQFSQSI